MEMPRTERRRRCTEIAISIDRGDPYPFCPSLIRDFSELNESHPIDVVLDLGCSVGNYTTCLSEMGFKVCGLDVLPEIIQEANKRSTKPKGKAYFVVGVGESLPFRDNSFDFVVVSSVLEHVRCWKSVIAEIYRVLKYGGLVFIGTTNRLYPLQGEVSHFPLFSYLPQRIKDRIIDSHPARVNYAVFPARHWFTPYGLRNALLHVGFTRVWEALDILKSEEIPHGIWQVSKPFLPLIKRIPYFLRFPFYLFIIRATTLWAKK